MDYLKIMKIRNGFVSNSSSCSFTIVNKTINKKNLVDFAKEVAYLVDKYNIEYNNNENEKNFIKSAKNEFIYHENNKKLNQYRYDNGIGINLYINPLSCETWVFGDEQGTIIGRILDYMLRKSDQTKSFSWELKEMLR